MTPDLIRFRPYRPRHPALVRSRAKAEAILAGQASAPDAFTIGLEEELFLVDAKTLDCVEDLPDAFHAEAEATLGSAFHREIIASMVELVTAPHTDLAAAGHELAASRAVLARIAARHGMALLACGTHPFADWRRQTLTMKPRYNIVADDLASLSKRVHICGLHVHVAIPNADERISVMNRIQQFLPLLLALSTSSPFWRGAATGLKSYRSAANDESPRTGLPMRFTDADEFARYVEKLVAAGAIPDQTFLWWAIRPSLKYPTLELRIADSCTDIRDAVAVAALYRCLVHALIADPTLGAPWENHHYLVNQENRWQAIRHGLDGTIIDSGGGDATSVRRAVTALVARLGTSARALGCTDQLRSALDVLIRGTSAERQSETYRAALAAGADETEALHHVAAGIARETVALAA